MANKKKDYNLDAIETLISPVNETGDQEDQGTENARENAQETPRKGKQKAKGNGGVVVSFRLDEDVVKKLKGYAFYNNITQKEALETIITEYLDGKTIAKQKED